jgi:hypothetical protein
VALTDYAIGVNHITAVGIEFGSSISAGTITFAASKSIKAFLGEGGGVSGSVDTENVVPVTSGRRNPVPLEVGTRFTLTEILRATGSDRDILTSGYYGATLYARVTYTRGGTTFVGVCLMTSYDESTRKGAIGATVTFETVDYGAANPTFTSGG